MAACHYLKGMGIIQIAWQLKVKCFLACCMHCFKTYNVYTELPTQLALRCVLL